MTIKFLFSTSCGNDGYAHWICALDKTKLIKNTMKSANVLCFICRGYLLGRDGLVQVSVLMIHVLNAH